MAKKKKRRENSHEKYCRIDFWYEGKSVESVFFHNTQYFALVTQGVAKHEIRF